MHCTEYFHTIKYMDIYILILNLMLPIIVENYIQWTRYSYFPKYLNYNYFVFLSYSWLLKIYKTGQKRDLEEDDLYTTLNDHSSSVLGNKLEKLLFKSIIIIMSVYININV